MKGLNTSEVIERRRMYGSNTIPEPRHPLMRLFLRQFQGIFNLLLLAAAIIAIVLGDTIDGLFILFFVFLGVTLNVYQEFKSNMAAVKLKSYLKNTITVLRDGAEQEIPTDELVPGDILKLESGDIVPADAQIIEATGLLVDETVFTGESVPVRKESARSTAGAEETLKLLQGVVIIRGNAFAEVTGIGTSTRLSQIAATASAVQGESELVKGIDRISGFILKATITTLAFVVGANILIHPGGTSPAKLLIFAIALAVSVIPEALPLVLTFSLSRGALEFAKRDVIVKRLSSVQDLGSINMLCSDKTGTITQNRLVLVGAFTNADTLYSPLLLARLAATGLGGRIPEPFDQAIADACTETEINALANYVTVSEEAFDPAIRSNGVILHDHQGNQLHIRRGSPDYFSSLNLLAPQALEWLEQEEAKGHRVLGVSYETAGQRTFAGWVSFRDAIKETTFDTLKAAAAMNVKITLVTGDALKVAYAVAQEVGLVGKAEEVIEAKRFLALPPGEQQERAGQIRVFARTTPEEKLELIQLLNKQYTVGFLGEGINDAPALKAAHVSMVVQSAADVARETADIILLQNDLRVIVDGIRLGRETHANTMKYIRATLVSNFGNFYAVAMGSLLVSFLPMLPKQLLLLNLLSDFPMMAIAFDRVTPLEVAYPQRYDFRVLYITFITLGLVSTIFDFVYFALFFRISPEVLQTNWFIASVITELLLVFSIRSSLPIQKAGKPAPLVLGLSAGAIVLTILLPLIPWSARFFEFVRPTAQHLLIILGLALLYLFSTEIAKRSLYRLLNHSE